MIGRMLGHALDPSVAEEVLLRHPEIFLEEENLVDGLVVEFLGEVAPFPLAEQSPVCYRSDAHIHVVEPYGVGGRAVARQDAVGEAVLLVHREVEAVVQKGSEVLALLRVGEGGLDHRGRHGSAVVKPLRACEVLEFHRVAGRVVVVADMRVDFSEEFEPLVGVVRVFALSRELAQRQHPRVGDAPFVGADAEVSLLERGVLVNLAVVGDGAAVAVSHGSRGAAVEVVVDPVEGLPGADARVHSLRPLGRLLGFRLLGCLAGGFLREGRRSDACQRKQRSEGDFKKLGHKLRWLIYFVKFTRKITH